VLAQSATPGHEGPVQFGAPHREFLALLGSVAPVLRDGSELVDAAEREWHEGVPERPTEITELGWRALLSAAGVLRGERVLCGQGHGDFAPWNTRLERGRLFVFDWESAGADVPLVYDGFHFRTQVAILLGRGRRDVERTACAGRTEAALWLLYLVTSMERLRCEGVSPFSAAITNRRRWIRNALQRRIE
jgi:hypothetical protein